MQFDLDNINQLSNIWDHYFFLPFYESIHQKSSKYPSLSYLSSGIAITDGIFSSIQAITAIAEATIKGIGNIFKGLATCNLSALKKGSLQLILGVGVIGLLFIPIVVIRTLRLSIQLFKDTVVTSEKQINNFKKIKI